MKKLFCIVLVALFTIPLLISCKDEKKTESATSAVLTDTQILGTPPEGVNGTTLNILTVDENRGNIYYNCELSAESETGSAVNDAVYKRTQILKETYGVDLKVTYAKSPLEDSKTMINAGDNTYQLVCDGLVYMSALGIEGFLWDLDSVSTLDRSHEWWDQTMNNDLSVAGYTFYLSGDAIVSDKGATWCCFFNKDMVDENTLEDPYQLVKDGKWTIDKMYEMAKAVSSTDKGMEEGTYGFLTQTYDGIASMISFNQKMITKDSEDNPSLNIQNEDTYSKFTKVFDVMKDKSTSLIAELCGTKEYYKDTNNIFFGGRGLFEYNKLAFVQSIIDANVGFEYGVLPLPKYNEQQDKYYSTCTVYMAQVLSIPITVPQEDLSKIGFILEVMGYYGQKYVRPAYYETTMKAQKMSDEQSEEMLDLIFENRIFDLASVYDFGKALYVYTNILCGSTNTITSTVESVAPAIQTKIEETIVKFDEITQ